MAKNYRAELVGVFGCPVDENPTGVVEEAAFAALGLNYRYLTIRVAPDDLEDAVKGIRAFNMRGINLTIPYKVAVLSYLDTLTKAAEIIGAVNTVINDQGKLTGENTDGKGYLISLAKAGVPIQGKHLTVLGAGGAARAIAVESALAGAGRVTIINRDVRRGAELAALIHTRTGVRADYVPWDRVFSIPQDTDILTNATSVGLFPHTNEKPDVNYDSLRAGMVVTDVIFNDPNSLFLGEAKKRGALTIDGLGMLVNQGALNFKLWTGQEAPVEVMERALKKEFS
ncbi:MAG: shikimate dehydrogenase [Spirochaetaceae bacterium]|jgi:shikimate dehydrogenase|nr:shikimate dehydrogenase [Spirochaetaceae bacterium]